MEQKTINTSLKDIFGEFWQILHVHRCMSDFRLLLFYDDTLYKWQVTYLDNEIDYRLMRDDRVVLHIRKVFENNEIKEIYYKEDKSSNVLNKGKIWRDGNVLKKQSLYREDNITDLNCTQIDTELINGNFITIAIKDLSTSMTVEVNAESDPEQNPLRAYKEKASIEIPKGSFGVNIMHQPVDDILDKFNIKFYSRNNAKREVFTRHGVLDHIENVKVCEEFLRRLPLFDTSIKDLDIDGHLKSLPFENNTSIKI